VVSCRLLNAAARVELQASYDGTRAVLLRAIWFSLQVVLSPDTPFLLQCTICYVSGKIFGTTNKYSVTTITTGSAKPF
jgi:hypothetical protein